MPAKTVQPLMPHDRTGNPSCSIQNSTCSQNKHLRLTPRPKPCAPFWGPKVEGLGFRVLGFRVRPTPRVLPQLRSHRPRQVWLGLDVWGVGGLGVGGGIITVPSAAAVLTCKTQYFGNPHAKTLHSCSRASDYQSIHAQTRMTFMFENITLPKHPCPNYNNVHVREHPITRQFHAQAIIAFVLQVHPSTRNTAPSGTRSMSFPGALMPKHHA